MLPDAIENKLASTTVNLFTCYLQEENGLQSVKGWSTNRWFRLCDSASWLLLAKGVISLNLRPISFTIHMQLYFDCCAASSVTHYGTQLKFSQCERASHPGGCLSLSIRSFSFSDFARQRSAALVRSFARPF